MVSLLVGCASEFVGEVMASVDRVASEGDSTSGLGFAAGFTAADVWGGSAWLLLWSVRRVLKIGRIFSC